MARTHGVRQDIGMGLGIDSGKPDGAVPMRIRCTC